MINLDLESDNDYPININFFSKKGEILHTLEKNIQIQEDKNYFFYWQYN